MCAFQIYVGAQLERLFRQVIFSYWLIDVVIVSKAYAIGDEAVNDPPSRKPERLIKTASHVCQIFDCFSPASPSLTLTEIAERIGLRGSSVHRLLRTLVAHRYLAVGAVNRRYQLGERLGNCSRTYARSSSVASLARPFLERLRACTDETVTLQMRCGIERQVVAQMEGTQSIRAVIDERRSYPLDAGAAGHVLRAFSVDWQTYADHHELAHIRENGYAVSRGELIPGAMAIYCPITDRDNDAVQYVVGVQGPEFRLADRVHDILGELFAIALALGETIPLDAPVR